MSIGPLGIWAPTLLLYLLNMLNAQVKTYTRICIFYHFAVLRWRGKNKRSQLFYTISGEVGDYLTAQQLCMVSAKFSKNISVSALERFIVVEDVLIGQ